MLLPPDLRDWLPDDHLAWFAEEADGSKPLLSLRYTGRAGLFDWSLTALADSGLTAQQKSYRISDHYPLWAEFAVPWPPRTAREPSVQLR